APGGAGTAAQGRSARPSSQPATAPARDSAAGARNRSQSGEGRDATRTESTRSAATGAPRDATASRTPRSRCGPRCTRAARAAATRAQTKPEEPYHSTTPSKEDNCSAEAARRITPAPAVLQTNHATRPTSQQTTRFTSPPQAQVS